MGSDEVVSTCGHGSRSGLDAAAVLVVEAALAVVFLEPAPAAGSFRFAILNRGGADAAGDGLVAFVEQRVVGDVVGFRVIPDVLLGPVGQRGQLEDPFAGFLGKLGLGGVAALGGLVPA